MGLLSECPPAAAISDVPINDCPESLGQIQKVILQRIFSSGTTKNEFAIATADPALLASWTPLLAASDGTKVVQTPYIQSPAIEAGAPRTYGGGNETLGGVEIITGREATKAKGNILQVSQDTIEALKKYQTENVGVFLVDEYGRIAGLTDDHASPAVFKPIPIYAFFVGDKTLGGLEAPDMNAVQWSFYPNWSDKQHIITPTDFNALTDLVTP